MSSSPDRKRLIPVFIALSLGIGAGIFGFSAGAGLSGSWPAAFLIGALTGGLVGLWGWKRLVIELDASAVSPALKVISGLVTIVALVQLGRLAVFMVDSAQVGYSSVPSSKWELKHSCLTAYFVAAKAAGEVPNLYDGSLYTMPGDDPTKVRKARMMGRFGIDVYEYPPPFLVLPRALRLVVPDFLRFRMLWFGLNGGVILFAMLVVARSLGPAVGMRAMLLLPFVWASLPTLGTLQKGNVQAMVIALSMLAMVLFERRRPAAGGTLLAYATVSKLYPGLLVFYLLLKREWRALAWTAVMGVAFALVTLLDLGMAPYKAFLTHLPGLLGGEAFPAFRSPVAMAINFSIPGLVFKLKLFGVAGMNFSVSKIVGWIYTLIVLWAIFVVSRSAPRNDEKPAIWMAILILATLRSPFLPQGYGAFPPLWVLTLLAAVYTPTFKTITLVLLVWLTLNIVWPMDWPMDPKLLAVVNALPQAVTIGLAVFALRRRESPQVEIETVPAAA